MRTRTLAGITPASFDGHVVAFVRRDGEQGQGHASVIGLRNEAGYIYRYIETTGMTEFIRTVSWLEELGLMDELADADDGSEGCDAIYRPRPQPHRQDN